MKQYFQKKRLVAILVVFEPNLIELKNNVLMHEKNFNTIILVNNSPEISLKNFQSKITSIIYNDKNIGLAAALNIGILEAKKRGAEMVCLFDQDTMLYDDFSHDMLQAINVYNGIKQPALYSPVYFNNLTRDYGSIINFKPLRLIRTKLNKKKTYIKSQYVITSGSFMPISSFDEIGPMCEELFIDFVDIEWCLRAREKRFDIISFPFIEIKHNLGDSFIAFMGTNYPIHSPLRMYYYFRNSIFLYRSNKIDLNWKLVDASRNLFRFFFYMLFVKDRLTYFKYIIKGYYHGFIKKMGKLEE